MIKLRGLISGRLPFDRFVFRRRIEPFGKWHGLSTAADLLEINTDVHSSRHNHQHPSMGVGEMELQIFGTARSTEQARFTSWAGLEPEAGRFDSPVAGKDG